MKLLRSLHDLPSELRGGAVTIGNFDGVHRGHARIVSNLLEQAGRLQGPAIVFTFDPHPVRLLRPDEVPPPLTWTDRKAQLLGELGVDAMIAYPTDRHLLELSARGFYEEIVLRQLGAKAMIEGPNFFFGHNREGNTELLGKLCDEHDLQLQIVDPLQEGDQYVSSSRIRKLIAKGAVKQAAGMLTRPYRIRGMVTHGAGRGTQLGFPTANLEGIDTLLPELGVYAGAVFLQEKTWPVAINIGPNPTFGEHHHKVEAHIIGYNDSLYGLPLEIDFLARLRDIQPFETVAQLKQQLINDIQETQNIVQ